jgi:glycosyl transferase, family 25
MQSIKTYVIHVRGNKERENYIRNELKKFNIEFEFILEGNMDNMTGADLDKYFKDDFKTVSPRTSCTIKHFYAYERMVENNIPVALVFEDDIELFSSFPEVFDTSLKEAAELHESFVISYESSTQDFIRKSEEIPGKVLYHKPVGRCAGAYLIDLTAAKRILEEGIKNKSNVCMDWFHNEVSDKGLIKIYWCHPAIAEQQSHNGKIRSLLDEKKQGHYYRLKYLIQKTYKQKILNRFR